MTKTRKPRTNKAKTIDLNTPVTGMKAGKVVDVHIPIERPLSLASIIITNIYAPKRSTELMVKSFQDQGHEVAVIKDKFEGNGVVFKHLLACYKRAATGHELFVYSDGADTFCQRPVYVPTDRILYSVEKNCYPKVEMRHHFEPGIEGNPFKYLNGGGYGGPLKLIIEFFERYGLANHQAGVNGQHEQMEAYLKAKADGFPIELDLNCEVFQTTAFTNDTELEIIDGKVHNKITGTVPAILHANGLSPLEWIYEGVKP